MKHNPLIENTNVFVRLIENKYEINSFFLISIVFYNNKKKFL